MGKSHVKFYGMTSKKDDPLPVAIFPVVFCSAVTCWMSGFAMPVVVLKQTVTVALSSGTLTSGTLGTTVATIGRR